jgi:acyl carrier protein
MKPLIRHGRWLMAALLISVACLGCGGDPTPGAATAERAAAAPVPGSVQTPGVGDRATIVERLRTELATLLKKDPRSLPIDQPVTSLGADDLDVVEWTMAAEEAFRVDIDDDKAFDPASKGPRKDLTITSMAAIVEAAPRWPPGRSR